MLWSGAGGTRAGRKERPEESREGRRKGAHLMGMQTIKTDVGRPPSGSSLLGRPESQRPLGSTCLAEKSSVSGFAQRSLAVHPRHSSVFYLGGDLPAISLGVQ